MPRATSTKADKKAGQRAVPLIPQKHGGALLAGGQKGQTPGPGRPPESIRVDMRQKLDVLLPDVLEDYKSGKLDKMRVVEFLAKYGLGTKDELNLANDPRVKRTIQRVAELVLEIAGPEIHAQIAARLTAEGL